MEYWNEAVSEALDAEGVKATPEQVTAIASWMKSAAECRSASFPVPDSKPSTVKVPEPPAPAQDWWRDRRHLVGSDWVLSGRIHDLIASRYS